MTRPDAPKLPPRHERRRDIRKRALIEKFSAAMPDENVGATPAARAYFAAFAKWVAEPRGTQDLKLLSQRFARLQRRNHRSALAESARRLHAGDFDGAASAAIDGLTQRKPPAREAARASFAWVLDWTDQKLPQLLYGETGGWRADDPAAIASLILFSDLGQCCRSWIGERLDAAYLATSGALRAAALDARVGAADRNAADRARLPALVERAVATPDVLPATADRLAKLLWTSGAYKLAPALIERFPRLEKSQVGAKLSWTDSAGPAPGAERLERAERDSAALWRRLGDLATRIAVIGNSPCDIGKGLGAEIDRHDVVIRFNLAPEDGSFVADYGARCDVKMLNVAVWKHSFDKTLASTLALSQSNAAISDFRAAADADAAGKSLAFVPDETRRRLAEIIGRTPSAGILLLGHLREIRGSLKGVSCFGFSLIDQIEDPLATHYFDEARPGHHDWRVERSLLDSWQAEAAA